MAKTKNPNTVRNNVNKVVSEEIHPVTQVFLEEYYNLHSMRNHPITVTWMENLARDLMDWAMTDDALRISDFTDLKGIQPMVYYRWVDSHTVINMAHEFAMRRIASRREKGALTRKYSDKAVAWTQGHYDKIFKDEMILLARLRDEVTKQDSIKILIEEIPALVGKIAPQIVQVQSEPKSSPEEVAAKVHKLTVQQRKEGSGPYVAKSKVKRDIKELEARMREDV